MLQEATADRQPFSCQYGPIVINFDKVSRLVITTNKPSLGMMSKALKGGFVSASSRQLDKSAGLQSPLQRRLVLERPWARAWARGFRGDIPNARFVPLHSAVGWPIVASSSINPRRVGGATACRRHGAGLFAVAETAASESLLLLSSFTRSFTSKPVRWHV